MPRPLEVTSVRARNMYRAITDDVVTDRSYKSLLKRKAEESLGSLN